MNEERSSALLDSPHHGTTESLWPGVVLNGLELD